jgi:ankyrin repeat protein
MAKGKSRWGIWLRLIPLMFLIGFVGWCTTNNRRLEKIAPVRTELIALFREEALIGSAPNLVLTDVAKDVGEAGMNRVLYDAAAKSSMSAVRWLVENGADPKNVGTMHDLTLLQQAALMPQRERIEYFLSFGLNPLERSRDGRTVLHLAAQGGLDEPVLALLQSKGLKLTDADVEGKLPLHYASVKSVAVLVKAGAEIDARDARGRTPLDFAARQGSNEVVTELLNNGASVFSKDSKGRTPLHYAVMKGGNDAVVDTLLAHGAATTARDDDGETPRDLVIDQQQGSYGPNNHLLDKL